MFSTKHGGSIKNTKSKSQNEILLDVYFTNVGFLYWCGFIAMACWGLQYIAIDVLC